MNEVRTHIISYLATLNSIQHLFNTPITDQNCVALDLTSNDKFYSSLTEYDSSIVSDYIFSKLESLNAKYGIGGYGENRSWYDIRNQFLNEEEPRIIHLGVDIWVQASTSLYAPLDGKVHSFKNNDARGDYGPTLILEHKTNENIPFFSLYGHLSVDSLNGKYEGQAINAGDKIGEIGSPPNNGDWAPHLHLQLMIDMLGMKGDFVGLCSESKKNYYLNEILLDPNLLLKLKCISSDA